MTNAVYLDHHATTPVDPRVVEAMLPFFTEHFGNPGSIGHVFGEQARSAVDAARASIANSLGVTAQEVVFTSGATESNNLAIRGIADRFREDKGHFVSMTTEHKAVLDPLARLQRQGFSVTLLEPVQHPEERAGLLELQSGSLADALREETRLVSIMLVNNEIGAIQPLREIVRICHEREILVHCDATQAIGKLPVNLRELDVDMLSLSGHKIYGPRGIGVLVVRRRRPRIRLQPLIEGGGQEQGKRSGTLNVPGIVGLAEAMKVCDEVRETETKRIRLLRTRLHDGITSQLDGVLLNGPRLDSETRLDGNLNLQFEGVDGEALMMNMEGIAVSSGSACTSANPEPSHVLRAIGLTEDATRSSLRFGIGRFNTEQDIDAATAVVVQAVNRLRSLSI